MLALVLVDSLHLRIEHGAGIHREAGILQDVLSESYLDVAPHLPPLGAENGILSEALQLPEVIQVADPAVSYLLVIRADASGYSPPASVVGDAIGHIDEFVGPQIVEVAQHLVLQQLRVQLGDAIHVLARHTRKVSHANELLPSLINDGHASHFAIIAREVFAYRLQKAAVDLVDDLDVAGSNPANSGNDHRSNASGSSV